MATTPTPERDDAHAHVEDMIRLARLCGDFARLVSDALADTHPELAGDAAGMAGSMTSVADVARERERSRLARLEREGRDTADG